MHKLEKKTWRWWAIYFQLPTGLPGGPRKSSTKKNHKVEKFNPTSRNPPKKRNMIPFPTTFDQRIFKQCVLRWMLRSKKWCVLIVFKCHPLWHADPPRHKGLQSVPFPLHLECTVPHRNDDVKDQMPWAAMGRQLFGALDFFSPPLLERDNCWSEVWGNLKNL